jgi:hypothetical protein
VFSKEETALRKQQFWAALGKYMQPIANADGEKVHWVNYKTGIPNMYFRMLADRRMASIGIEFTHNDAGIRSLYIEQMQLQRIAFESMIGEQWQWDEQHQLPNGKVISKIYKVQTEVNVLLTDQWPAIISFLKPRMLALDEWWSAAKPGFEALL